MTKDTRTPLPITPPSMEPLEGLPSAATLERLKLAQTHKKHALGKLISLFENIQYSASVERHRTVCYLNQQRSTHKNGLIIGLTGTPGAGKSSVIDALSQRLLSQTDTLAIAVLAVDPSSQVSGGAILGDRTRMRTQGKTPRLFFRSQASNNELGGVTHNTYQATRLLRYFFDLIIIETVGIGQNEIDIQHMTDHTFLVMQPLAGDQIQFMKCGIMEIPDSFIVNKCDEQKLAHASKNMLRTSLRQAKIIEKHGEPTKDPEIFMTSATHNIGIDDLSGFVQGLITQHHKAGEQHKQQNRELFYLNKRIMREYGEFGCAILNKLQHENGTFEQGTYEQKYLDFKNAINKRISD